MDPGKWNQSKNDSLADSSVLCKGNESEQERRSHCDNKEKEYMQSHVAQRRKSITGILTGLHSSFDMADVEITSCKIDSLLTSETFVKRDNSIFSEEEDFKRNDVSDFSEEPVHDQTLATPNSSTSLDVKTYNDGDGDTTMDAIVSLTRTPSKKKVFAKARSIGDNAKVVDKASLRETTLLENERCQTSLGMVGGEDHERLIQENINQSKSRSYTPGLPPIPRSKTSSTSRRNMKRIQVSPRVDLLMNSDLFRKNLENHKDLLHRHSVGYSFGMKKSVSNLDLSLPFDHEGKSDSENVKSLNLARGTSKLDQARTNLRRDENCSENNPSSEISGANSAKNRNNEVNSHRNPALKTSSRRYSLAIGVESSLDIYEQSSHPRSAMGRNCIPSFDEFKRQRQQKCKTSCPETAMLNPKSPATLKNEISHLVFDFEHSLQHISEEANKKNNKNANSNQARELVQLHTSGLHSKANQRIQFVDSSKNNKQKVYFQQNKNDESLGNENKTKFEPLSETSQSNTVEEFNTLTEESVNNSSAIISSPKQIIRDNPKETYSVFSKRHLNIDADNNSCDLFSLGTEGRQETDVIETDTSVERQETDVIETDTSVERQETDVIETDTSVERLETDLIETDTSFKGLETDLIETDTSFKRLETHLKETDSSVGRQETDLMETDTSFKRQETNLMETDTSFKRQETNLMETDTSFKRQETDLIETDTSFKRQETNLMETDTSFKRQETDLIETDSSVGRQETDLIETDTSFKRQETDLIETDSSVGRQETDLIETDSLVGRQETDLIETDSSFERQEIDLKHMNTSFSESADKSLPISKNALKFKSDKCNSQKHEKYSNSIKKKFLSVVSIGSGKKKGKNESVNKAKTCENTCVQKSVDIETEVNEHIYSSSCASQKQGTVNRSDPCKGNNSSLMHNKTEYRGSNSSMTEDDGSEVFFLTREESITSSIQSIPDSLNAENVDKFQEFDDYEYEDRKFSMKGSRENVSPVLRSTSDACNATAEAVQKRRERKERPYKSDPFTGLENLPSHLSTGLRHHRSFASSSREEILSFLGNATIDSSFTHHDSSPSLEELHEDDDEDESLPETAFEKERKGRNRLSSASITSTDSGVIGQDSQISPTSTLSVTHTSTWPDLLSQDLSHDTTTTSIVCSQSEITAHQKLIKCADCGQDKKPAYLDINLNTTHKDRLCKQCYQRRIERKETIQEISDTEISYGRDLLILKNEFYNPMKTAGLLKSEQLDSIFLNLDELIHVNMQFTTKLKAAVQEANENEDVDLQFVNIGSLFLESSTMFLTFENYCVNQEQAPRLLEQYEKEKELLRIFLHVSQNENILLRRMHLKSFLMVPVQRIMKYPLLLDRLYKATPPSHNDKEEIREAKDKIEDILGHINAKTKSISGGILKLGQKGRSSLKHYSLTEKMEINRVALEVLGWNRKDVCEIITSRLQMTQAQDHTWASRKCKNLKFSSVHGILLTLGEQSSNDNNKNLMFPRKSPVKQAAVILIKEKNGKYQAVREPFMLEKCIVTVDPDYDEVFELLEWNRDPYLLKAGTPKETNMWSQHLKQLIQDLGCWRRRRNALPNILLHIHPE